MDNPPPNYDPNQSLLDGGVEPIVRVMGGGGHESPPDGYNTTASMYDSTLSSGSGANVVIEKVEGGAMYDNPMPRAQRKQFQQSEPVRVGVITQSELSQPSLQYQEPPPPPPPEQPPPSTTNEKWEKSKDFIYKVISFNATPYINNWNSFIWPGNFLDTDSEVIVIQFYSDIYYYIEKELPNLDYTNENIKKVMDYTEKWLKEDYKNSNLTDGQKKKLSDWNESSKEVFNNVDTSISGKLRFADNYIPPTETSKDEVNTFISKLKDKQFETTLKTLEISYKNYKNQYKPLTYKINVKSGNLEAYVAKDTNKTIYYIPFKTEELVVLPTTDDPRTFFYQLKFLIDNKFLVINSSNELKLKKKIFVVILGELATTNKQLLYLRYRLKIPNFDKVIFIEDNISVLYPAMLDNKYLFITTKGVDKIYEAFIKQNLSIINFDMINTNSLRSYTYKEDQTKGHHYDSRLINFIQPGDSDPDNNSESYNFTLKEKIAIIKLKETDSAVVSVDLQGETYAVRLPRTNSSGDRVYAAWMSKKFTQDEKRLLEDLNIQSSYIPIPDFLYYLSVYKCFNDTSLLTDNECTQMRKYLEILYKKEIEKGPPKLKPPHSRVSNILGRANKFLP